MDITKTMGLVFQYDIDRAISTRFTPREKRHGLLLLVWFDHELAKIRHQTSEPLLRRIRLQFWRDALDGKEGSGTDFAKQLTDHFVSVSSSGIKIADLVEIHEKFVEEQNSTGLLWNEYNERQAVLFRLASQYLDPVGTKGIADSFFDHCGVAYGGAQQLCRYMLTQRQTPEEVENVMEQIASARNALAADLAKISLYGRPGILPLALVSPYLHLFQRAQSTAIETTDLHPLKKSWLMWRAMRKGFEPGPW